MDIQKAKEVGLTFEGAQDFMPYSTDANGVITVDFDAAAKNLAMDADLTTAPNVNVPAALVTYIDPQLVPILFTSMNTTKVFKETKKDHGLISHSSSVLKNIPVVLLPTQITLKTSLQT